MEDGRRTSKYDPLIFLNFFFVEMEYYRDDAQRKNETFRDHLFGVGEN